MSIIAIIAFTPDRSGDSFEPNRVEAAGRHPSTPSTDWPAVRHAAGGCAVGCGL